MIGPAYTMRQMQDARTLLADLQGNGIATIAEALAAIAASMPPPDTAPAPPRPPRPCPTIRPDGTACPGHLQPVHNSAGLTILGCRVCRYSEVA